ncbi:MAG: PD-(D/E)XK nuclease family protein [Christensenellaceae bacterium]|nr:PD-(D/E)XK nuclease family protein [Christensenellaceae bacterium]
MSHYYQHEDRVYPSVTTIIQACVPESPGIGIWRQNLVKRGINPATELRRTQIVGTLAHYRCLNPLGPTTLELPLQEIEECTPDILRDVELCEVMFNELLPTLDLGHPRVRETFVAHEDERYGGKFDLVAPSGGVNTLFDIKTSRQVYDTHLIQMGGYSAALRSNRTRIHQGAIITLHYKPENNPTLRGIVRWINRDELDSLEYEFVQLARKFWSTRDDSDLVANCKT